MRVLVTGASGFVGSHVAQHLWGEGHTVIPAVQSLADAALLPSHLSEHALKLDLERPDDIGPAVTKAAAEAIVHCAAYGVDYLQQDPLRAVNINVRGTLLLGEAAADAGTTRFVHMGTAFEYGHSDTPLNEETPLRPNGIYGATKASAAVLIGELGRRRGIGVVILRAFGLYGPGEGAHKLIPQIINAARSGTPLEMGSGAAVRDYLFVGDAARALAAVATVPDEHFPADEVFNLCSGHGLSIRELATAVAAELGAEDLLRFDALADRPGGLDRVVGDPALWSGYCRRIGRADLGTLTPLPEAVRAMMEPM